jgi:glutamate synthase (ferredoxin)
MCVLERLEDPEEAEVVRRIIRRHADFTRSQRAFQVLALWEQFLPKFVKVVPKDYQRVLHCLKKVKEAGLSGEEAIMAAFEENARDVARIGGG